MLPQARFRGGRAGLEQALERRIMERTWRRVCQLRVEVFGERIVIKGRAPCYYAKQLAIAAVLEGLDEAGAPAVVDVRIDVSPSPGRGHPPAGV
jgi:hypothetical protein